MSATKGLGTILFLSCGIAVHAQSNTVQPNAIQPNDAAAISDHVVDYSPITPAERFHWIVDNTLGVRNLAAGVFTAAWGTMTDSPREYGPHWDGYAKRYFVRLADGSVSHTMEAGLGSLWGEDPRFFRAGSGQPFKSRLGHVMKTTFMTTNRNGEYMPAYARYTAIVGTDFLANTWKPDSHATTNHALLRIPISFVDRFVGHAFSEFWPDIRERVFKKRDSQ